jgi:hypothetical protein
MKKINYFLLILIVFGANSARCTNPKDSMEVEDILRTTNKNGKEWLQIWGLKKLTENDIKLSSTKNIVYSNGLDESDVDNLFKIYSDSSFTSYVDIYSGAYYIDSNNLNHKFISEPESVLKLFYKDSLSILLHFGYSIVFHDAIWINNNKFLVVGYEIEANKRATPIIWYFNLITNKYSTYRLMVSKEINDSYLKIKFHPHL